MTRKDDFSKKTILEIAARVGYRCSVPHCRATTSGPQEDETKSVSIGVAGHITAASPNGPRFDPTMTSEQRKHPSNGIWLCQNDGKLVDNDTSRFSKKLLQEWKQQAEEKAFDELGKSMTSEGRPFLNLTCRSEVGMNRIGQGYQIDLIFGIQNVGLTIARHLVLEICKNHVFNYNRYGINGNGRHGLNLQQDAYERNVEKYVFAGQISDVLHPNRSLEVAKFTAKVTAEEALQRVQINYEIYCEGYSRLSSIEIGLEEEIIRHRNCGIPAPRQSQITT